MKGDDVDQPIRPTLQLNLLLLEDNPKFRSAFRLFIEHTLGVRALFREVSAVNEMFAEAEQSTPDILLIDWDLKALNPGDLLPVLRQRYPGMKIYAFSGRHEARKEAMLLNVDAFISNWEPPERWLSTLDLNNSQIP
jgi:DNA-binding NarL/FixJ family response regulator